jgi:hypothetical protein
LQFVPDPNITYNDKEIQMLNKIKSLPVDTARGIEELSSSRYSGVVAVNTGSGCIFYFRAFLGNGKTKLVSPVFVPYTDINGNNKKELNESEEKRYTYYSGKGHNITGCTDTKCGDCQFGKFPASEVKNDECRLFGDVIHGRNRLKKCINGENKTNKQ